MCGKASLISALLIISDYYLCNEHFSQNSRTSQISGIESVADPARLPFSRFYSESSFYAQPDFKYVGPILQELQADDFRLDASHQPKLHTTTF